jgi:hypothetical protein
VVVSFLTDKNASFKFCGFTFLVMSGWSFFLKLLSISSTQTAAEPMAAATANEPPTTGSRNPTSDL